MLSVTEKIHAYSCISPNVTVLYSAMLKIWQKFLAALQNYQRYCHFHKTFSIQGKAVYHRKHIV